VFLSHSQSVYVGLQEFDWEAAVREIDDACQASTSTRQQEPPQQPPAETVGNGHNRKLKETHKNSRQSTLDIFISNGASKPYSENPVSGCEVSDEDEKTKGKERACYVDIDPEAAKTWIYPGISISSFSLYAIWIFWLRMRIRVCLIKHAKLKSCIFLHVGR